MNITKVEPPPRNAVRCNSFVAPPNYLNHTNTKDRNILLNKPTVGSVWEGVCCGLSIPWGTPLRVAAFVVLLYWLNHNNTRRARHVPEQTYRRISSGRNMSYSSLMLMKNATRLHSETRNAPCNARSVLILIDWKVVGYWGKERFIPRLLSYLLLVL